MSQIKSLIGTLKKIKDDDQEKYDNIKFVKNPNLLKYERIKIEPSTYDKTELRQRVRSAYKQSWRDCGYTNSEFNSIKPMRPKILNSWEQDRVFQPERNYITPEGFKGFKTTYHSRELPQPTLQMFPVAFQKNVTKSEEQYKDFLFTASKYGKLKVDIQLEKVLQDNKQPFRRSNTKQQNDFKFGKHNVHEFQQYIKAGKQATFTQVKTHIRSHSLNTN